MSKQWSFRALAVLLVLSLLVTLSGEGILTLGNSTVSVYASGENADGMTDSYITYNGTLDLSTVGDNAAAQDDASSQTLSEEGTSAETEADADAEAAKKLYSDGMIHIFNFRQLQLIGSLAALSTDDDNEDTIGKGALITDEDGYAVLYAPDAHYFIEGDIALPQNAVWKLPEYFTGKFSSEYTPAEKNDEAGENDGETADVEDDPDAEKNAEADRKAARLYDAATDTIYIQNIYQLKTLADSRRAEIPVMSGDWNAEKFGTGQFIFPGEESQGYLTYSSSHHYVISETFTAEKPDQESLAVLGNDVTLRAYATPNIDHVDGRDYFGQVVVTIDGVDYILIGDRQQLDAINFGGDAIEVYGPVFKVSQKRDHITSIGGLDNSWHNESIELIYPGDADLINGLNVDGRNMNFGSNVLYDGNNDTLGTSTYHGLYDDPLAAGLLSRTIYCTIDPETGECDTETFTNPYAGVKYTRSGNYIVFRDIDLNYENWTPLMFNGNMFGVKSTGGGKLWNDAKTQMNIDTGNKPKICHINVVPAGTNGELDVITNTGVGFFATLGTQHDGTNSLGSHVEYSVIRNLALSEGEVRNEFTDVYVDQTLVSAILTATGDLLGTVLDPVLSAALGGRDVDTHEMLTSLLNAHKHDPTSLATGAFAGRVLGEVDISDCLVENISVVTRRTVFEDQGKIVGKGGFVGYIEGEFEYDDLSEALQEVTDTLAFVLNLIPGVGLGDLVDILLNNTLPVGKLVPTGYSRPLIERCTVSGGSLSSESGKIGVGGFVGTMAGTFINDSKVVDSTLNIKAERFGGGFAGIMRDEIVRATLGDLGIIVGNIYPQSELIDCSIEDSPLHITGDHCLGGFVGTQANSYSVDCTIDEDSPVTIVAEGDCIGGFSGSAQLGSSFGLTDYLPLDTSLLSLVKGVLVGALSENNSQELLALGGISEPAILGCRIDGELKIDTHGSKVGGIVGSGEAVLMGKSSKISELNLYADNNNAIPPIKNRGNTVERLIHVRSTARDGLDSDNSMAGGAAGYLISANSGSLLGDTLGLKSYLGFLLSDTVINGYGNGYVVEADGDYAGGAIGFAIGGDVNHVDLNRLLHVSANNHAGGFVGTTGPDMVVGGNGLDLNLLGIDVLKIDNLVGLTSGIHTTYSICNINNDEENAENGVADGFTVEATGTRENALDSDEFTAGGFAGDATSTTMTECVVHNLLSVTASDRYGIAGGFVGRSAAGDLSNVSPEKQDTLEVINVGKLLTLQGDLIPSFDDCEVYYVDAGFVQANAAGGFTGEMRSGDVNQNISAPASGEGYVVHNIDHVLGGEYAGGFGGKVHSGSLMRDGGSGLELLSGVADLDVGGLASITTQYIPTISYAGVDAPDGFSVLAASIDDPTRPAVIGYAGGFIGYGSGMQVSHSHVKSLRHGSANGQSVNVPANLEEKDGGAYMTFTAGYDTIPYAVAGATCAGGYVGYMNVGSARALGDSLKLLGESVRTTGLIQGLDVIVSTVEHSDVYGCAGGYSVLASSHVNLGDGNYDEEGVGYAGGFVGRMAGAHVQNSNAENFAYVIGEITSGGYAGEMHPGDVADVLDYQDDETGITDVLNYVIETDDMAQIVEAFVPTIYNSRSTCIPCGGAVRAQSFSDSADEELAVKRGYAGGYVGHASGAQILGSSNAEWGDEDTYTGPQRDCDIIRIRSVYGAEYAGGFVGLLESAGTADTGDLTLLGGLLTANNLLGALEVIYPTLEKTNVYGPLEKTDLATWNNWVRYIGKFGGFASELSKIGTLNSQSALDNVLKDFIYGYHVEAGRDMFMANENTRLTGCAGGYAGAMHSGIIRYSTANDAKQVRAMRSAGGFAGEVLTRGMAELGSLDLIGGLSLDLGALVNVTSIFVPVIFESGVTGYQNGLIVRAEGSPTDDNSDGQIVDTDCGIAGGFVGDCQGGQIGNRSDGKLDAEIQIPEDGAWVRNLKTVMGRNCVGGFAGKTSSAALADVDDSEFGNSYMQAMMDSLIENPSNLVEALDATVTVIGKAEVREAKPEWGIVVDGEYKTDSGEIKYAQCAGGFVGSAQASVFGARNAPERTLIVTGLRGVSGGLHVGGFFGLAHVGSVAEVGESSENSNALLNLIKAGDVSVLDVFRTYIYHATVNCYYEDPTDENSELIEQYPEDGLRVIAHDQTHSGTMSTYQVTGSAGGFGGALMNGTVENSRVCGLNYVDAKNYSGGFIGMLGTTSGISVDEAEVMADHQGDDGQQGGDDGEDDDNVSWKEFIDNVGLDLATNPQLLNVVGSTVVNCSVKGFDNGFITRTSNIQEPDPEAAEGDIKGSCAAGFAGFADMAQISDGTVTNFKYAMSPQTAGGFVGRSAMNYLVDVDVDSKLTAVVVKIVNVLVKALYLDHAEALDLINYDSDLAGLKLMADGDLLYVNLFGMKISAALSKNDPEYGGEQDAAIITIGTSTIKLPCDENGVDWENENTPDITITLIEGNRTNITGSSVVGIADGYNVYAGGADDGKDGEDPLGYAGGFIGYNDAGAISESFTELCDVIRGTPNEENQPSLVGPFAGYSNPRSRGRAFLEDNGNHYHIYRVDDGGYTEVKTDDATTFGTAADEKVTINGESCNDYEVQHLAVIANHEDLKDAVESGADSRALNAYISPTMEVLMLNVPLDDNGVGDTPVTSDLKDPCDTEFDLTVNKVWKDFIYLGSRPETITVTIAQVEAGTTPPDAMITSGSTEGKTLVSTRTLTLDNSNDSTWSTSWQATVEDLPVAVRKTVGNTEQVVYYQYIVNETAFDNYTPYYEADQASASATITNRYTGPLIPDTGGEGVMMVYALGLFLLIGGTMMLVMVMTPERKRKLGAEDVELEESNFSDFLKKLGKKQ